MIYTYETTKGRKRTFELSQSMKDEAYTHHPETGVPIRRVITGGSGFKIKNSKAKLTEADMRMINSLPSDEHKGPGFDANSLLFGKPTNTPKRSRKKI